ncbi:MAG: hypothetical protein AAF624_06440, partial [Bacteroidota bacterium]
KGALASLFLGLFLGVGRLVLEIINGPDQMGLQNPTLAWFAEVNFLHMGIGLFAVCSLVLVGVSLATAPPPPEQIAGLTFGTSSKDARSEAPSELATDASTPSRRRLDLALTGLLILAVLIVWMVFS